MSANSPKSSPANRALWVIAFSLLTIAICFVALMVKPLFSTAPKQEIANTDSPLPALRPSNPDRPPKRPLMTAPSHGHSAHGVEQANGATNDSPNAQAAANDGLGSAATSPPESALARKPQKGLPQFGGLAPQNVSGVAEHKAFTIFGHVTLSGTPPPEKSIVLDQYCASVSAGPRLTKDYVVSSDGSLANVMVFIRQGIESKHFPPPSKAVDVDQSLCEFHPYVFGAMTGQYIKFHNSDPFLHNVDLRSSSHNNSSLNFSLSANRDISRKFSAEEFPLRIRCDIHPWMLSYAFILKHPFYSVTDDKGNYTITNVPPGNYLLEAFHVKTHLAAGHGVDQVVVVGNTHGTNADFAIDLKNL